MSSTPYSNGFGVEFGVEGCNRDNFAAALHISLHDLQTAAHATTCLREGQSNEDQRNLNYDNSGFEIHSCP
ncbi:hypothetical protein F0562_023283 [Nyssa sinensis]|uniref:Uncharacterized protein n=1 Tax=Nyssa sinensis TaxID=561372 RepID=A0A5J5BM08_9ASTE|nr:hypothetical protein F0562_023283 [Nyssa sinensis]